ASLCHRSLHHFPTRRSSDLLLNRQFNPGSDVDFGKSFRRDFFRYLRSLFFETIRTLFRITTQNQNRKHKKQNPSTFHISEFNLRSEEHTSELQSRENLVCRL